METVGETGARGGRVQKGVGGSGCAGNHDAWISGECGTDDRRRTKGAERRSASAGDQTCTLHGAGAEKSAARGARGMVLGGNSRDGAGCRHTIRRRDESGGGNESLRTVVFGSGVANARSGGPHTQATQPPAMLSTSATSPGGGDCCRIPRHTPAGGPDETAYFRLLQETETDSRVSCRGQGKTGQAHGGRHHGGHPYKGRE